MKWFNIYQVEFPFTVNLEKGTNLAYYPSIKKMLKQAAQEYSGHLDNLIESNVPLALWDKAPIALVWKFEIPLSEKEKIRRFDVTVRSLFFNLLNDDHAYTMRDLDRKGDATTIGYIEPQIKIPTKGQQKWEKIKVTFYPLEPRQDP